MTPSQPYDTWRVLASAVLAWLLVVTALEFSYVAADPDLWGHIYFGADHWSTGTLRRSDPYSFTAAGLPWINHEWLAELIFFLIYDWLGDAGLLFGKLLLGLAVVFTTWRLALRRTFHPLTAAAVFSAAVFTMKPGFMIRPQLFSFLLFSLELALLQASRPGKRHWMAGLPIIMALWVNLHGGFLMGGLIVALFILTESAAGLRKGCRWDAAVLWGWGFAGALATLVNPYGIGLHRFVLYTLSLPRSITEWAPVCLLSTEYLAFKMLFVSVCISLWRRRRDILSWESLALIIIGAASFLQQRHMVFFAILAAPFLVDVLSDEFGRRVWPRIRPWVSPLAVSLIASVFVIFAAGYAFKTLDRYRQCEFRIVVDPEFYPVQAMSFLKVNQFRGNLLVDFDWGEYAIWHLYPDCKVSIDGRFRTVYPQNVIDDQFLGGNDVLGWHRTLAKYPADILLVRQQPFFQQLIHEKGQWVYIYSDPLSIVFVRELPHNKDLISRLKNGELRYRDLDHHTYFPG